MTISQQKPEHLGTMPDSKAPDNRLKKIIMTTLGCLFLGLGAVGIVTPGLPTTPFVLLAAICFSIGNKRIYGWLQRNRVTGPYIENYRTKQGIKRSWKIASIAFLWVKLIIAMVIIKAVWSFILLGTIGVCVTTHLLMIKTKKESRVTRTNLSLNEPEV